MTETDRIYLRDSELRSFDATVVEQDEQGRVALDVSAFYPTGGGQPHDTGALSWAGGSAMVSSVSGKGHPANPLNVSDWVFRGALGAPV